MNPERATSISVCLAFLILSPAAFAQQQADKPAVAVGMIADGQQPAIDGKVDDEIWKSVPPFTTFTQQEPDEGEPGNQRDTSRTTPATLLGQSFVVKMSRLFDF
jgi:hypothetical protein